MNKSKIYIYVGIKHTMNMFAGNLSGRSKDEICDVFTNEIIKYSNSKLCDVSHVQVAECKIGGVIVSFTTETPWMFNACDGFEMVRSVR